jgi:hypothetical protein
MKSSEMRATAAVLVCCAFASRLPAENMVEAEFRAEGDDISKACFHPSGLSFATVIGCPQVLVTGSPLHIAVGSLAPQNGFGAGLALTLHKTPNENWRLFWDFDAVATPNGSWRAGGYMTAVLIRHPKIVVLPGGGASAKVKGPTVEPMPAFHLYSQAISLNNVAYFGLGQNTPKTAESWFGMRETIVGANVAVPVYAPLNLTLTGEANGRFTAIRADDGEPNPSIEQLYTNTTAPGLVSQPAYAQFGEGIGLSPSVANGHVQFNYSAAFQEWVGGTSGESFRRFSTDLSHVFSLYNGMRALGPQEFNGPDSCRESATATNCPPVTHNLEGSFGLEFLYTASYTSAGSMVPFYLDPTIGGSDINGASVLPSYADYRFRGPDLMVFRGSFEHSIYKWPVGAKFMVDEGRVGLTNSDLGFSHLAHSYAVGLTVHAGGLPVIDLLFAWGGHEGNHTIATVDNALLGGSSRPSLQ